MDDSFSLTANVNDDGNETSGPSAKNLRIPFNEERPVACWEEEDLNIKICIAPNLVCSEAQQTAGGGDNISAAGLVMQV